MSEGAVLLLVIGIPVAVLSLVGGVLWWSRRRPVAGLGPRLTTGPDGVVRVLGGTWNARIFADGPISGLGGTLGSRAGEMTLVDGVLSFTPEHATQPEWSVTCPDLRVATGVARPVRLDGPFGTIHCTVSIESVGLLSDSDLRSMREVGYARDFARAVVAHGARPSA